MKNQNLKLKELKVKSFVTEISKDGKTVGGGSTPVCSAVVLSAEACPAVSAAVASAVESILWAGGSLLALLSIYEAAKRIEPIGPIIPPQPQRTFHLGGTCPSIHNGTCLAKTCTCPEKPR